MAAREAWLKWTCSAAAGSGPNGPGRSASHAHGGASTASAGINRGGQRWSGEFSLIGYPSTELSEAAAA